MKSLKPYLEGAVTVIVVLVVFKFVKPYLPASLATYIPG